MPLILYNQGRISMADSIANLRITLLPNGQVVDRLLESFKDRRDASISERFRSVFASSGHTTRPNSSSRTNCFALPYNTS